VASDADGWQAFGNSVAISDDTILVGSWGDYHDVGMFAGSAYVFVRTGSAWSQQAKLVASDGAEEDRFGSAVTILDDLIVVGARGDDDQGNYSGSAYVFTRGGTIWSERTKLTPNDGNGNRYFGSALAVTSGSIVVGAPGIAGGAYVFTGSGATWSQEVKLVDGAGSAFDRFGTSVDIDMDTVVVGSPFDDNNGTDSGTAIVFKRSGILWNQVATLVAGEGLGQLGTSVAIHGARIAAGAPEDHQFGLQPLGAVYLFLLDGNTWAQADAIHPSGLNPFTCFGESVATDGTSLIVGTPGADDPATNVGGARGYVIESGISAYCFGEGTCPCGNLGSEGAGCANSTGLGGKLVAFGYPSVSLDEMTFQASNLAPNLPGLLFSGNVIQNGGNGFTFGDGLRCAGGQVRRYGVAIATGGMATWGPGIAAVLQWSAGDLRYVQAWYRDPNGGPCGSGFNLTNGIELTLVP